VRGIKFFKERDGTQNHVQIPRLALVTQDVSSLLDVDMGPIIDDREYEIVLIYWQVGHVVKSWSHVKRVPQARCYPGRNPDWPFVLGMASSDS